MRIWFDTEFLEDGKTIDLISIGMVREDGQTYYAENSEADEERWSDWIRENVAPHLKGGDVRRTRSEIAQDILLFAGESPEFWAYFADYDWVVLCQLYGRMIDLPKGWPMFCRDLKQLLVERNVPQPPKQGGVEHHALADAMWVKAAHEWTESRPGDV